MKNKFELESERLLLRPIQKDDDLEIFNYRSDSITNKYQGWIPETLKDTTTFINKTASEIDLVSTWYQLVILENKSNKIIGDLGIHFFDLEKKQVEIGITLDKNFHGKGLASEALNTIIGYLFNQLNKHRIIASLDPKNSNSIKLFERIGFREEAHFKESLLINDVWVNDVIYAILKREWIKTIL